MRKHRASVSYDEMMKRKLKDDPEFAAEYLKAALEDTDEPKLLLIALRRITEARGGFTKIAKAAGIERESLHRALSLRGNPRLSTLVAVTRAVGLRLTVEAAKKFGRRDHEMWGRPPVYELSPVVPTSCTIIQYGPGTFSTNRR